jgi:hypothetical protein
MKNITNVPLSLLRHAFQNMSKSEHFLQLEMLSLRPFQYHSPNQSSEVKPNLQKLIHPKTKATNEYH